MKSNSTHGFCTVTPRRSGKFVCDCPNCQSLGICAHTVAVAEVNQKLPEFVTWYRQAKKLPSISKLAMSDMPRGRGRKGGKPLRKRKVPQPIKTGVELMPIRSLQSAADSETLVPKRRRGKALYKKKASLPVACGSSQATSDCEQRTSTEPGPSTPFLTSAQGPSQPTASLQQNKQRQLQQLQQQQPLHQQQPLQQQQRVPPPLISIPALSPWFQSACISQGNQNVHQFLTPPPQPFGIPPPLI